MRFKPACSATETSWKIESSHVASSDMQPSLSERVIVDGHGCHTALHFGVKANKKNYNMRYML